VVGGQLAHLRLEDLALPTRSVERGTGLLLVARNRVAFASLSRSRDLLYVTRVREDDSLLGGLGRCLGRAEFLLTVGKSGGRVTQLLRHLDRGVHGFDLLGAVVTAS
jgi:hypothetical protein